MTGGGYTLSKVSVYDTRGWIRDLPDLKVKRHAHACGHYVDENDRIVSIHLNLVSDFDIFNNCFSNIYVGLFGNGWI